MTRRKSVSRASAGMVSSTDQKQPPNTGWTGSIAPNAGQGQPPDIPMILSHDAVGIVKPARLCAPVSCRTVAPATAGFGRHSQGADGMGFRYTAALRVAAALLVLVCVNGARAQEPAARPQAAATSGQG